MKPNIYTMTPGQRFYHRNKERGLCTHCGKSPPWNGTTYCATCLRKKHESMARSDPDNEKRRAQRRALWNRRREQGLCVDCGKPALKDRARCDKHQTLNRERAHVRLIKARIAKEAT